MNNNWYCDRESARTKYDYYAQKDTKREVFQNISESGSTHSLREWTSAQNNKWVGAKKKRKDEDNETRDTSEERKVGEGYRRPPPPAFARSSTKK